MLQSRPLLFGLISGIASHAIIWLLLYAFSLLRFDIGFYIVLLLLVARLILFFCLNLNALGSADTCPLGLRFACGFILPLIPLILVELYALSFSEVLSFLDPHSSFLTGLAFVLFWFAVAIEAGMELLVAALQALIHTLRPRHRTSTH